MKTFEKEQLDYFLELPLTARLFIETDKEYSCIHDDNDGEIDQRIIIILKEDNVFHLKTPTSPGLRFRNYAGGGSSLEVHNALKVLIYASFNQAPILPGLQRKNPRKYQIIREIEEILDGVIILPSGVFGDKTSFPHYFFEITPYLKIAISVDGDTHIITEMNTEPSKQTKEETTFWNPEPFSFCLKSNCSRAVYNALILLALAIKQSRS